MKALFYLILAGFLVSLLAVSTDLPRRGSTEAPLHRETSSVGGEVAGTYFVQNAYRDTGTDNIVTVVLADYRGFDTFGEVVVVFAAGAACLLILRGRREE